MNFWENGMGGDIGKQDNRSAGEQAGRNFGAQGYGGDFADKFARYEGKSEQQLMGELLAAVGKMKAEGSFDPSSLDKLFCTAYPFLSEGQRARMREIIDMLKK